MTISRLITLLFYLSALTVYTPLLPIDIETQPIIFIITLIIAFFTHNFVRLKTSKKLLYLYFILVIFSMGSFYYFGFNSLIQLIKYSIPFSILLIKPEIIRAPPRPIQNIIACLHVFIAILYFTGNAGFLSSIYGRYTSEIDSVRGFCFFSYEPSYASTYLIALFMVARYSNYIGSQRSLFAEVVFIACIIVTKSFLGLIYVLLCLTTYVEFKSKINRIAILVVSVLSLGMAIFSFSDSNNRLTEVSNAANTADHENLLESFIFLEPSGTSRILNNIYSFRELFYAPLGHGVGSFESVWPAVMNDHNDKLLQANLLLQEFLDGGRASSQSYFACLIFETGLLGVLIIICVVNIFLINLNYKNKESWIIFTYFLIFTLVQSQNSNPIYFYTLILLCNSYKNTHILEKH